MKTKLITLGCLLAFANLAPAITPAELDNRVSEITYKFDELQHEPGKRIPADTLHNAQGILLVNRTKAGVLFAYEGGSGVAMVKNKEGQWGPIAFVKANEPSLGFQAGGEQHFVVVLMMTTNATRMLTEPKFEIAGQAGGTAGHDTAGVSTAKGTLPPTVLIYDDRAGLFGGASIKANAVTVDNDANHVYYGDYFTMSDILFGHRVKRTPAAISLADKIQEYSRIRQASSR